MHTPQPEPKLHLSRHLKNKKLFFNNTAHTPLIKIYDQHLFGIKNMLTQELQKQIKEAAEIAFRSLRSQHPDEIFCGYALYSDHDAMTVCPSANTVDHLERMISSDPTDANYYRWSPAEWKYEFVGAEEHFDKISRLLYELAKNIDSATDRSRFKQDIYECCVNALAQMRTEGFFVDLGEAGVIVFAISDSDNPAECDWIAHLNPQNLAAQFKQWIAR